MPAQKNAWSERSSAKRWNDSERDGGLCVVRTVAAILLTLVLGLGTVVHVGQSMWAGSSTSERSHEELRDLFFEERATFARLRDRIRDDAMQEVRADDYNWCDGCSGERATGRPPGVAEEPCDWPHGCGRWVDEPPTPQILAAIAGISERRAAAYLDDLRRVDAILVREEHDGSIVIWMEARGIIPSGSATMIAWTPAGVARHTSDETLEGSWSLRVE